jgi:hypothetical protein
LEQVNRKRCANNAQKHSVASTQSMGHIFDQSTNYQRQQTQHPCENYTEINVVYGGTIPVRGEEPCRNSTASQRHTAYPGNGPSMKALRHVQSVTHRVSSTRADNHHTYDQGYKKRKNRYQHHTFNSEPIAVEIPNVSI